MTTLSELAQLPRVLLPWYRKYKRELPWRNDRNPYHIWISEIMLQQTRVEAVKGYYVRFIQALPNIEDLAQADDEVLCKLWEGLGYYSRVRNLKKAAQKIVNDFEGSFPSDYNCILSLPGIGPYTAGAVASIAFNQQIPAVDGNVLRVFSRLTEDSTPIDQPEMKRRVAEQLAEVYPQEAGEFTQAIMELGATICGPNRIPDCPNCPCQAFCKAHKSGTEQHLPVKKQKKKRKEEQMTVFILSCDGEFALEKRGDTGLLAGLWQFPNISGKLETQAAILQLENLGVRIQEIKRCVERSHIFTHVQWDMIGVYAEISEKVERYKWFLPEKIRTEAALPTAFRQFWNEIENDLL